MMPNLTICEAIHRIRQGELRPSELIRECLARIDQLDNNLKAWVLIDSESAIQAAELADKSAAKGHWSGPLHGIPIGIKDIIDIAGHPTKAGSSLRENHIAKRDAHVVTRLRTAGAIILGKTVTTQWACFDPAPTRNPINPAHTPGGSSSGSAAAVAAGMCLGALGSQTGGSIVRPAAYCGVAGLKPSFGLVGRSGIAPVSHHLDHVGPIASCAADLEILHSALVGFDPDDQNSVNRPPAGARAGRFRFGIPDRYFIETADAPVRKSFQNALDRILPSAFESADVARDFESGLRTVTLPAEFEQLHAMHWSIMAYEAAQVHQTAFGLQPEEFGPKVSSLIQAGQDTTEAEYQTALAHQSVFRQQINQALFGVDALLMPSAPTTAPTDLTTTGDPRFNSPWSYAGLPSVTIPCGLSEEDQMPIGLQLVGRLYDDETLIRIAMACETALSMNKQR